MNINTFHFLHTILTNNLIMPNIRNILIPNILILAMPLQNSNNIIISHLIRLMLILHFFINILNIFITPKVSHIYYLECITIIDRQNVLLFLIKLAKENKNLENNYGLVIIHVIDCIYIKFVNISIQ